MCILFIYRNPNANINSYRLILAANRDEFIQRPALPAHFWKNHPTCIGGIDMEPGKEGGTWLALSKKGKAGVILNLTNETVSTDIPRKGRGTLITDYVTSDDSEESYLNKLHKKNQNGQPYNSYNLVLIDLKNANVHFLSSSMKSKGPCICENNILGFGNSSIEIPYQKVEAGKEKFKCIIENAKVSKQDDLIEDLLKFLKLEERYLPDPELQRRSPKMYKNLSSIFVTADEYGTRTHSVILVNGNNEMIFVEETLMPDSTWKRQLFNMNMI